MRLEIYDKDSRERLDIIRKYTYVYYLDQYCDLGSFEVRVPIQEQSLKYLNSGNFIWFENNVVGIISYRAKLQDEEDDTVTIKGFLLNDIVSYRCIDKPHNFNEALAAAACSLVDELMIHNSAARRNIPFVTLHPSIPTSEKIVKQMTGGSLDIALQDLLTPYAFGYEMLPVFRKHPEGAKLSEIQFKVLRPTYRTKDNIEGNTPVVFSFDMDNLSRISYEENETLYNNVAYVAGEGEGTNRKVVECGEIDRAGMDRKERYVDARDLQSVIDDVPLSDAEYTEVLIERGLEKLAERMPIRTFDGTILIGNGMYVYGEDFYKGDFVTVEDPEIGLSFDVQIVSISRTITEDGREYFDIKFGRDKLSINRLLRKGGL